MNRFQDGTWHFRAQLPKNPKEWEVVWRERMLGREARALFFTEEEARKFADANGGKVKHLAHRGGFR